MSAMAPVIPGARAADLFAGSGALGLEALSRGAEHVIFVERSRAALTALRSNIESLGAGPRARVVARDVFRWIGSLEPGAFDLALADPPYERGDAVRLVEGFLERPFAGELWIEHRISEILPVPADARTRRYGDTAITRIEAPR